MDYSNKSTHFLGFVGSPYVSYQDVVTGEVVSLKTENNIDLGNFKHISTDCGSVVLGYFEKEDGQALMVADSADPRDLGTVNSEISFETDKKVSVLYNGKTMEIEGVNGKYVINLSNSCGVFITIE